jgi:hypothetical protein
MGIRHAEPIEFSKRVALAAMNKRTSTLVLGNESMLPQLTEHRVNPSTPFWGSPVALGLGLLHSACVHVLDEATIHQTIRELQKLDDRALNYIGLQRSEIEREIRTAQKAISGTPSEKTMVSAYSKVA